MPTEPMSLGGALVRVAGATTAFAAVHSLLASRGAKEAAARGVGRRARNGWYRVAYLGQSVVTLGALGLYLWRLPDRELYRAPRPVAALMHVGQGLGLLWAVWGAARVGIPQMLGLSSAWAWLRGEPDVPAEPEAQGPAPEPSGQPRVAGPFRLSQHPLNVAPLPVFWLWPRMTAKLLVFNLAATLYLVLGSYHEAARLRAAYGAPYAAYQRSRVPFYWPWRRGVRLDAAIMAPTRH